MVKNSSYSNLNIKMNIHDGFIALNKEKGCTSHDCVKKIRKLLGKKKVGHTGTLDPQVTGTLPIAIGSATKFIQYLPQGKTYIGKIQLGIRTTTDDMEGEILNKKEWPMLSNDQLDKYLNEFRGIIKQVPPKVSSVHVNGVRAYKKAFRNEEFELDPKEIEIEELVLQKWDQVNGILEIKVSCTSGTYIRSIARDLGQILDSEGCLMDLKRISACGFHEENSIKISEISDLSDKNEPFIIPTISAISHISTLTLTTQQEINFWQTGRVIKFEAHNFIQSSSFDYKKPIKIIDQKKILLGIGFINKEKTTLQPKLVLNAK